MGLNREQALDCFASDDLIGIGMEADAVRRRLHPESVVSYATGCVLGRGLSAERIFDEIAATVRADGTEARFTDCTALTEDAGGCESLFAAIEQRFPQVSLTGVTASDVFTMCNGSMSAVREKLFGLRNAGLRLLAGEDAGMLSAPQSSSRAPSVAEWLAIHRLAHALGLPTNVAMTIGAGETAEERVQHLESLQQVQAETGGFRAFALLSFQPQAGGPITDAPTSVEYLKTLAISRMVLDGVPHVMSSPASQGTKVLQMGLRFGANDAGMVPAAAQRTGASRKPVARAGVAEEEIRRVVRDAGFKPAQRDGVFTRLFLT